ncbi:MAG: histidinol-phosphate transaminase [Thermoproteota archaeon]
MSFHRVYPEGSVRLDLNESPYPPPREVLEAASRELSRAHLYPDGSLTSKVVELLSEYTGLNQENILVTAGADGSLHSLFAAYVKEGSRVAVPRYSFPMFKRYSSLYGGSVAEIPMEAEGDLWRLDLDALFDEARRSALVVVDNPNNPTGAPLLNRSDVEKLASETEALVIIDEAYYEFYGKTVADLVRSYSNVVVVRTFSKAFALAGMRVGYILAPEEVAERVRKAVPPFAVTRVSLAAAAAALESRGYVEGIVKLVKSERERLRGELSRAGFRAFRSETNFLLVDTGIKGAAEKLRKLNIFVRKTEISSTMVRVTVGRPEDNKAFLEALGSLNRDI